MGLFDTIRCEYPLPDPRLQDEEFQTKDLECLLETYTITADGRLVRKSRPPAPDRPRLDRDVEWPLHGDILIYAHDSIARDSIARDSIARDPDRERGLVDFVVRFTHGRVEWIRRFEEGESPRAMPPLEPREIEWPVDWPRRVGAAEPGRTPPDVAASEPPLASEAEAAAEPGEARAAERRLLANLHRDRAELEALLDRCDQHWGAEDAVYRFYHQSFKVYALQQTTEAIVERLRALAPLPGRDLDSWFCKIVTAGTGLSFEPAHNSRWLEVTRPMIEAFFHARYFLQMAVRYAALEEPPSVLPSGYAALLHLYRMR